VFTIDSRLKGLPVTREQVVSLYQSINSPNLAVPGMQAGPAQAFILGVRGSAGFVVFVYLYLAESAACAVYVPERRNLSPDEYKAQEQEALAFVESMGFMVDNLNFRAQPKEQQERMLKTLPLFQREPAVKQPDKQPDETKVSPALALGRLLASF
jgi:hypothetical protein